MENQPELREWAEELQAYSLPRWEELPDFELYLDQTLNLLDRYLSVFKNDESETLVTSSMVHNYVKLKLIPKPVKKRYTRKHLAYLIAITILKQVLTIPEIKKGIMHQASVSGTREAYDLFCREQEYALRRSASYLLAHTLDVCPPHEEDYLMLVRNAAMAAAAKVVAQKILTTIP